MVNKKLSDKATKVLALLKEATVISKKDGSRLTEDERFFVFLCGYWSFAQFLNDAGGQNLNKTTDLEIMENGSQYGVTGIVSMATFINGGSEYIKYLLSTFSPKLQDKYESFCIRHEFDRYPNLLTDIESYTNNIDYNWIVETKYRDYICLSPDKSNRNVQSSQSLSNSANTNRHDSIRNPNKGCFVVLLIILSLSITLFFV